MSWQTSPYKASLTKPVAQIKALTDCGMAGEIGFQDSLVQRLALLGALLYWLGGDPAVWVYVLTVAGAALLLASTALRYSRALMLYWFGGSRYYYDPAWQQGQAAAHLRQPIS